MTTTCGCGQPIQDAYACTGCARATRTHLRSIPDLWTDLELATARRARFGDPTGRRSADHPLPYVPALSDLGWVLRNTLHTWARAVLEAKSAGDQTTKPTAGRHQSPTDGLTAHPGASSPDVPAAVPQQALWLSTQTEWIRHQDWASEAFTELAAVVTATTRAIDRPPERKYAGRCPQDQTPLYANTGSRTATCGTCHSHYDAADARQRLLDSIHDTLGTAPELARALTALGLPASVDRLYGYAKRRRLVAHGKDPADRPLYRLGDALQLLQEAS